MDDPEGKKRDPKQAFNNLTLAVIAGQVGCLTLVIVLLAVLGGMWLDNQFQTSPILTIALVILSIPVSLWLMFVVVRAAVARIKTGVRGSGEIRKEGD